MDNLFLDNIDSFLITLEKERNFSSHTIKAYKNDLNRFNLFLQQEINNIELKEINRNDIRKFLADEYENGYTSKTVARRLATLKSFFKYLVKVELIDNNGIKLGFQWIVDGTTASGVSGGDAADNGFTVSNNTLNI